MRLTGRVLLGILLCSPLAAGASEDNSPQGSSASSASGQLEEITVTAQKRSERELDVPLSISAVSVDTLERQGITSVADLEKIVPGFTYQPSQYGTPI
jgi:iron complex outermembrane receptor protein